MVVPDIDMRAELAALPRQPGALPQPRRTSTYSLTLHYSGVVYRDRSRAAELAHITAEAREHLRRDWRSDKTKGKPIYGSLYQYEWAVLSDGATVLLNDPHQFWHAGNQTANRASLPVHVLLGRGQDLTPPQNVALGHLFDNLRAHYALPPTAVYGHCEWPRGDGPPQPSIAYRPQPGQSECPGATLHPHLVSYRTSPLLTRRYRVRLTAWVRQEPARSSPRLATLLRGATVEVSGIVAGELIEHAALGGSNQWARLLGGGYVWLPQLEAL